jgi:hypothetical protein
MNERDPETAGMTPSIPNGSAAAAILSAGICTFVFSVVAFAGDKSPAIKNGLVFYKPTGALSGVATVAVGVWILCWVLLEWRWGSRSVALKSICTTSLVLLGLSLLLTFPPIVDLL